MWNQVLNIVAGTIGMSISGGLILWLAYYGLKETPNNKELNNKKLEEDDNETHK